MANFHRTRQKTVQYLNQMHSSSSLCGPCRKNDASCDEFRQTSYLFSLTAKKARIQFDPQSHNDEFPYLLCVSGISNVTEFQDREEGKVQPFFNTKFTPGELVSQWGRDVAGCSKGKDHCNFCDLPPNGILTFVKCPGDAPTSIGVILKDATLLVQRCSRTACDGDILFRAAMLGENGSRRPVRCDMKVQSVSLFIDNSSDNVWSTGAVTSIPMSFVVDGATWTLDGNTISQCSSNAPVLTAANKLTVNWYESESPQCWRAIAPAGTAFSVPSSATSFTVGGPIVYDSDVAWPVGNNGVQVFVQLFNGNTSVGEAFVSITSNDTQTITLTGTLVAGTSSFNELVFGVTNQTGNCPNDCTTPGVAVKLILPPTGITVTF